MTSHKKIERGLRLNVAVLLVAYLAAILLVIWGGHRMESDLSAISGELLPASQSAVEAALAFDRLLDRYETAILTGEPALLDEARREGDRVDHVLAGLVAQKGMDPERRVSVHRTSVRFHDFYSRAHDLYARMTSDDVEEAVLEAVLDLADDKEALARDLHGMAEVIGEDLQQSVSGIAGQARQRAGLVALLFFGVVLGLIVTSILRYHRITADEIAERLRTENSLRESEQQFRVLFEHSPDAIFVQDEGGYVLAVNDAAARLHGMTREQLVGMNAEDLVPPADRERVRRDHARWLSGALTHYLAVSRTADGSDKPVEIRAAPVQYAGGRALLLQVRDISARLEAEEALRKSEARNRATVAAMPDVMFRFDREGRYLDYHAANPDQLYVPPEKFLGRSVEDVLPGDLGRQLLEYIRSTLETRRIQVFEYELDMKHTGVRHFEIRMVPAEEAEVLAIVRDVTDRRKLEEEQVKIDKLESLGVLAGGIAHDFNNLLTAILGNITLARRALGDVDPNSDELLAESENASLRARHLTQQLLTFARGGEPVKKVIRVDRVVNESAAFVLRGSACRVDVDFPDALWPVYADAGQIGQVIQNLVLNAEQAMPNGGMILIRADNLSVDAAGPLPVEPGRYVRLSIKDQGIGIPPDYLEKIFDPYFTTKKRGTGLGLASCLSIVRKHGGHISVDSRVGEGSTFRVYLPAADAPEKADRDRIVADARLQGRRILLMDDEEAIRKLTQHALEMNGCAVTTARDGNEAITLYDEARARNQPFDVVILDLTVPGGMGGKEAMRILRARDPGVRIIIASGYSNDPDVAASGAEDPATGVLSKPFQIRDLTETVRQLIHGPGVSGL